MQKKSETLAAIIVANRVLGSFKDEARLAMIELMKRKKEGDLFDFNKFIEDEIASIPQPDKDVSQLISSISKIGSIK